MEMVISTDKIILISLLSLLNRILNTKVFISLWLTAGSPWKVFTHSVSCFGENIFISNKAVSLKKFKGNKTEFYFIYHLKGLL